MAIIMWPEKTVCHCNVSQSFLPLVAKSSLGLKVMCAGLLPTRCFLCASLHTNAIR